MFDLLKIRYRTLRRRGICLFAGIVAFAFAGMWTWFFAVAPGQEHFVLYFSSTVHGLSVGAPVQMNGQDIGRVSDIRIVHVPAEDIRKSYYAAVTISVSNNIFKTNNSPLISATNEKLPALIRLGLRGQLRMPSLLATGLCVSLYFDPGQPVNYINPPGAAFPEIPTNYKSVSDLVDQTNTFIETKNLYALAEKIRDVRAKINAIAATAQLVNAAELNSKLLTVLEQAGNALNPILFTRDAAEVNSALSDFCRCLETADRVTAEQTEDLRKKIQNITRRLREIRNAAQTIRSDFSDDSGQSPAQLLRELQNQCSPLINFGKKLFL